METVAAVAEGLSQTWSAWSPAAAAAAVTSAALSDLFSTESTFTLDQIRTA